MKTTKTTYTIEITTEEAELIREALHNHYKKVRDEWENDEGSRTGDSKCKLMDELRTLRNAFCNITDTYYMGKDA